MGTSSAMLLFLTYGVIDSDQDGIPDAWMIHYFGHPTGQPGNQSLATDDPDGDGMNNLSSTGNPPGQTTP
jgi:hypothetical protein